MVKQGDLRDVALKDARVVEETFACKCVIHAPSLGQSLPPSLEPLCSLFVAALGGEIGGPRALLLTKARAACRLAGTRVRSGSSRSHRSTS